MHYFKGTESLLNQTGKTEKHRAKRIEISKKWGSNIQVKWRAEPGKITKNIHPFPSEFFSTAFESKRSRQNLTFNLCSDPQFQRSGPPHHTMTSRCLCGRSLHLFNKISVVAMATPSPCRQKWTDDNPPADVLSLLCLSRIDGITFHIGVTPSGVTDRKMTRVTDFNSRETTSFSRSRSIRLQDASCGFRQNICALVSALERGRMNVYSECLTTCTFHLLAQRTFCFPHYVQSHALGLQNKEKWLPPCSFFQLQRNDTKCPWFFLCLFGQITLALAV